MGYVEPQTPNEPGEWDRAADLAADLAAAAGTTPDKATEAIRRALTMARSPSVAIFIDFRWYERPRRLWRRRALYRTARLGLEDILL